MSNSVLRLNLKKEFYDQIKSGEKDIEYRENKPYWRKRIKNDTRIVHFYCGYPPKGTPPLARKVRFIYFGREQIEIHLNRETT